MKPLNIVILGQGRSGRNIHGMNLLKMPEMFKITAIVDSIKDRRERAEKEFGCETYDDYRQILTRKDIDLVVNALPSHYHVPVTAEFLRAGFNVLCEKPLARKAEEVDMLIDEEKKSGKKLAIFQQSRYAPYFTKIKKILESGVLGRIIQISIAFNGFGRRWDWQTLQEYNGGNLLNTGPHPVDQALQLFGTDVMPQVLCFMDRVNTSGDAEDYAKIILSGKDRPIIDVEISSCCAYPSFTYNIHGTNGGLKSSQTNVEWKYFISSEEQEQPLIREPLAKSDGTPSYCSEKLNWHEENWSIEAEPANTFTSAAISFYSMLYKSLTENAPLEITPSQVRQQIAVMEECHRQNPLSRKY